MPVPTMLAMTRQVAVRSEIWFDLVKGVARGTARSSSAIPREFNREAATVKRMNVLVFGQGKTGTTVLAKTIQHSLPDAAFVMEPKPGALFRRDASHTVVKILHGQWKSDLPCLTSLLRNQSATRFDRIVKVLRDPRDQAISILLYKFYGMARAGRISDPQIDEVLALLRWKEKSPGAISFAALCAEVNRVLRWKGFTSTWLFTESGEVATRSYWDFLCSLGGTGHLLRYEDFMQNRCPALETYLGFKLSVRREVGEYGRTRRSASWENWREFFTAEDVELLRPLIGRLLVEMGYPGWDLRPVQQLNSEHFSGYLTRLIQEARSC
jgi:hypothetical protein